MFIQVKSDSKHDCRVWAKQVALTAENELEARILARFAAKVERDGLRLGDGLEETLALFKNGAELTATECLEKLNCHIRVTGMNNRLKDLYEMGFLKRTKDGRQWLYSRVKDSP